MRWNKTQKPQFAMLRSVFSAQVQCVTSLFDLGSANSVRKTIIWCAVEMKSTQCHVRCDDDDDVVIWHIELWWVLSSRVQCSYYTQPLWTHSYLRYRTQTTQMAVDRLPANTMTPKIIEASSATFSSVAVVVPSWLDRILSTPCSWTGPVRPDASENSMIRRVVLRFWADSPVMVLNKQF